MNAPTSAARGHRLWLPITFAALTGMAITVLRLQPEVERNIKNALTALMVILGLLLVLLWFMLLSRFPWRTRLWGLAITVVAGIGLKVSVRVDGTVDGTGRPKIVWRWSPKRVLPQPLANPSNASITSASGAKDVPQFFGPQRDGVVRGAGLLPDWKQRPPKELWRQPIGAGWSAFSIVGGRAHTQEQRGNEEAVSCYELLTGRLLWMHTYPAHFTEWQGGEGPRATPIVHEGRVFAVGATGILNCLDATIGKMVWSRDILKEYKMENIEWGISASPLVFEDTVVVTGGKSGPTLLAFRAATGEPLWQSGKDSASYASPILATLLGKRVVLSFNATALTAHDPATGVILMEYAWGEGIPAKAAQPVVVGDDRVFLSAGYHAGCIMLKIEASPDGKLAASKVWDNLKMKTQFNSVALREGYLYGLDDNKLACLEVATGERKWKEGRFGSGQSLLVDDLVIVQSEPGDVVLASANPERYQELGRIAALDSKTWNHPVLAGRYLLLRNDHEAVCYELPLQK
ncbi:MAG: PQQ-binding-like beta-propeller repeat protein [Prosthecobacter sp.]|nr:PQQ-binding-like beta-propeller repeat protein [Prosthecobacter sp.]